MSAFRSFARISANVTLKQRLVNLWSRIKLPEKYKGGRLEKIGLYWKTLCEDYRIATRDIIEDAKNKPKKAAAVLCGLGLLGYAVKTNPDEQSFINEVASSANALLLLSDAIRNPLSDTHVHYLERCISKKVLRTVNLLVLTVIWEADYGPECDTFAARCSYLKPQYLTFHERVVDIGIAGVWLNLAYKMWDYDVNEREWAEPSRVV